jgi:predicted HTH domain antitoxin
MSLVISDELLKTARMSEQELLEEIILLLFQQEKLTLGKASQLLGMNQIQFQHLLASRKICVHYDIAEFREDVEMLKTIGWL